MPCCTHFRTPLLIVIAQSLTVTATLLGTRSIVREESIFSLLHRDSTCKVGQLADYALHVQWRKLGFSVVGLPGETERPFNPHRVLLGAFFFVLNQFMKIYLGKFSQGKIGYTGKCKFPQGNLIYLGKVASCNHSSFFSFSSLLTINHSTDYI